MEESGQLEDTIIFVTSDNGSSAEGGPNGSFNENKFFNNVEDSIEANLAKLDELGTPTSYNHYCTGWAWAFDTPFPYWKRYAGYEGGSLRHDADGLAKRIEAGGIRHQYLHAIDVVPTLYDLLDLESPDSIKGYPQSAIEGESFAATLFDPEAAARQTQFYAMLGMRSLYHEGWLATALHPTFSPGWGNYHKDVWELYHLAEDRAQTHNLAQQYPQKLQELIGLWFYNAGLYNGFPIDDRTAMEQFNRERPTTGKQRNRYVYYPQTAEIPERVAVAVKGRSYAIAAQMTIESAEAEGVISPKEEWVVATVSMFTGEDSTISTTGWVTGSNVSRPNRRLHRASTTSSPDPPAGQDPATQSAVGRLRLFINQEPVGEARMSDATRHLCYCTGTDLNVGREGGSPVSPDYQPPFTFTQGPDQRVVVDVRRAPHRGPREGSVGLAQTGLISSCRTVRQPRWAVVSCRDSTI